MLRSDSATPRTYIGLISDASDDPINSTSSDTPTIIPAGFGLLENGSGGFDMVTTDGTTVLKAGLEPTQWYNVWIAADNEADTFELCLSKAPGPVGEAKLPAPEDRVGSRIPFGVATTEPLTGMIFTCPSAQVQSTRIFIDEIYWDGDLGLTPPKKARHLNPAHEEPDVPKDVILSWTPGLFAATHDVYFGTSFDDVNDASRTNPLGVLVSQSQVPNSYSPAAVLQWEQTYYWRVDEVNAPPDITIYKGEVWQFTVESFAYPIAGTSITATASSQFNENQGPEKTIDGSGLDANDLHSTEELDIWLSNITGPQPTWIQYEFDRVYKLHQMWVWNHNNSIEPMIGFGIKDATIEYSTDGANWATLATVEFARAPGAAGYAYNTTVDLSGVVAKYVKITANSNWGGVLNQYGLSEVRFFYVPVVARKPVPASGTTDVPIGTIDEPIDVTLSFRAGRDAASHNMYFSTDGQAVIDGTAAVTTISQTSYGPLSLDLGKTYYWRVDEVNEAETPATWQSDVWNFSTQEYLVVDDFDDYNDFEPDRIFDTWIDGWADPTKGGSQVGYANAPFAEQTIVHEGKQSMPLYYNNDGSQNNAFYSEATRTFDPVQDWTRKGVNSLTLWFRGEPGNAADQLYVALADSANNSATVKHPDTAATIIDTWQEWNIDLAQFTGVNPASIKKMSIGVGDKVNPQAGGSGKLSIDDIRLYPARVEE